MSISTAVQRFTGAPPRNVGGGDLVTRVVAILGLLLLVGISIPQVAVPYPLLKIALLVTAELGLMSLMLGLFLNSKTYFAGLNLFVGSLAMLWLVARGLVWAAMLVGLLFVVLGLISVVTRRSRLNALLELNSLRVPLEELEAEAEALAPLVEAEGGKPGKTPVRAASQPLTHGGAR